MKGLVHCFPSVVTPCQEEANVGLNSVPSVDAFTTDILHGKWDKVLPQVAANRRAGAVALFVFRAVSPLRLIARSRLPPLSLLLVVKEPVT